MTTQSLGDILRKTIEAEAKARQEKLEREAREEAARLAKEKKVVTDFFASAEDEFTTQIVSGRTPKGIEVGRNYNVQFERIAMSPYDRNITTPGHTYYSEWAAFQEWARSNGLEAKLEYQYDGMGVQSWHVLCVSPIVA